VVKVTDVKVKGSKKTVRGSNNQKQRRTKAKLDQQRRIHQVNGASWKTHLHKASHQSLKLILTQNQQIRGPGQKECRSRGNLRRAKVIKLQIKTNSINTSTLTMHQIGVEVVQVAENSMKEAPIAASIKNQLKPNNSMTITQLLKILQKYN